jgi:hypothetical protein
MRNVAQARIKEVDRTSWKSGIYCRQQFDTVPERGIGTPMPPSHRNAYGFPAAVDDFVVVKALRTDSESQLSISWPQGIQSKVVIFTRFQ